MDYIVKSCHRVAEKLKKSYTNAIFGVEYDKDTDIHHIWYNKFELKKCERFTNDVEALLEDYFLSKGIYNVFVAYFFKYDYDNKRVRMSEEPFMTIMPSIYIKAHYCVNSCSITDNGEAESGMSEFKFYERQDESMMLRESVLPTFEKKNSKLESLRLPKQPFTLQAENQLCALNLCYGKPAKHDGKNENPTTSIKISLGVAA